MATKNEHAIRSSCPMACALDIIGDHWSLLVVRDLLLMGKHEYKELLESDEGISSNILSDRLRKLQDSGLLDVIPHPESNKRKLYFLTTAGKDLIHVLLALARWSAVHRSDAIFVPEEMRARMAKGPDAFSKEVMRELAAWEKEYGV